MTTLPPAASTALRAAPLAAFTWTVTATWRSPPASSLMGPWRRTRPRALSHAAATGPAAAPATLPSCTPLYSTRVGFVTPRFGRRRWIGIWPPSNHTGIPPPERAFLPLWPLPAVPPWPVAAPLPRRFVCFIAPAAGWMFPSLMTSVLLDRHQVADLEDHAPDLGRVGVHHGVLHLADAERAHGGPLVLRMPARALRLGDLELTRQWAPASRTSPRACGRASPPRPRGGADASARRRSPSPCCADCACRGTW